MAKRMYDNDYSSVTQALAILRKIGLEFWFKYNTSKFCDAESNRGKLVGKQIHVAIQSYIETKSAKIDSEYAAEVENALNSFMLFRKENPSIKLSMAEVPLTSEKYKFNGTIDAPEPPILCDWKGGTAKEKTEPPIYDEYLYQVAAYVKLWNEKNSDKLIDTAYIVALAKDKVAYNLRKMEMDEIDSCFNEVFLPALQILNYQKKGKKK